MPASHPEAYSQKAEAGGKIEQTPANTFVDMSVSELVASVPELKHLEPAENQGPLPEILKRAGDEVAAFFDNFPNTTCTEQIISLIDTGLGANGTQRALARFNYLALVQQGGEKDRLREFRADDKGEAVKQDSVHLVVTLGFISMIEHLHPDIQPDSHFVYLGREELQNTKTYVVAFAQIPSVARRVTRIQYAGQDEIAFLEGIAWIDPTSFSIRRLRTEVLVPPTHRGILKESTQILYSEVCFEQGKLKLWLPREVDVTGQLDQNRFHNQHRYSDYRLFNVQVKQKGEQN